MSAYAELEQRFRRMANLGGAAAVLQWDWAAIMLTGGAQARAAQLAELELLRHEMLADPKLAALLGEAESACEGLIPSSIEGDSFRGFPNGKKSESMRRTDTEVCHGQSGCVTGRF